MCDIKRHTSISSSPVSCSYVSLFPLMLRVLPVDSDQLRSVLASMRVGVAHAYHMCHCGGCSTCMPSVLIQKYQGMDDFSYGLTLTLTRILTLTCSPTRTTLSCRTQRSCGPPGACARSRSNLLFFSVATLLGMPHIGVAQFGSTCNGSPYLDCTTMPPRQGRTQSKPERCTPS